MLQGLLSSFQVPSSLSVLPSTIAAVPVFHSLQQSSVCDPINRRRERFLVPGPSTPSTSLTAPCPTANPPAMIDPATSPPPHRMLRTSPRNPEGKRASFNGRTPVRHDQILDGPCHFLARRLGGVGKEMALNVLPYDIKRTVTLVGIKGLMAAIPG